MAATKTAKAPEKNEGKTLKATLRKSSIGAIPSVKATVQSLAIAPS